MTNVTVSVHFILPLLCIAVCVTGYLASGYLHSSMFCFVFPSPQVDLTTGLAIEEACYAQVCSHFKPACCEHAESQTSYVMGLIST